MERCFEHAAKDSGRALSPSRPRRPATAAEAPPSPRSPRHLVDGVWAEEGTPIERRAERRTLTALLAAEVKPTAAHALGGTPSRPGSERGPRRQLDF